MAYTNTGSRACVSLKGEVLSTVKSYNITRKTSQPHSGVTSNSKAGTLAVSGALDWSAGCVSWSLIPGMIPGESGEFKGCQGIGLSSTDTPVLQTGPCVCTQLATNIDIKNRAPIEWTYTLQGAGQLVESAGSMEDTTTPIVVRPVAGAFTVRKAGTEATLDIGSWNLAQVSFSISSAVSGGGATSSSNGWFRRLAGPMNFTFEMTFENDRLEDLLFDVGDELDVTIELDNGETMAIKWIHITGFGDATLDNSSAEPITIPASGTMAAYSLNGGGYGSVSIGGVQIWPIA